LVLGRGGDLKEQMGAELKRRDGEKLIKTGNKGFLKKEGWKRVLERCLQGRSRGKRGGRGKREKEGHFEGVRRGESKEGGGRVTSPQLGKKRHGKRGFKTRRKRGKKWNGSGYSLPERGDLGLGVWWVMGTSRERGGEAISVRKETGDPQGPKNGGLQRRGRRDEVLLSDTVQALGWGS